MYLVTALVPSETACLASSPGRRRRTAVWISREVMVDLWRNSLQGDTHSELPLVVVGQLASLSSNALEEVIHKRVHDGHCLRGHPSVRVHLLQHLHQVQMMTFNADLCSQCRQSHLDVNFFFIVRYISTTGFSTSRTLTDVKGRLLYKGNFTMIKGYKLLYSNSTIVQRMFGAIYTLKKLLS